MFSKEDMERLSLIIDEDQKLRQVMLDFVYQMVAKGMRFSDAKRMQIYKGFQKRSDNLDKQLEEIIRGKR